MTNHRHLRRRLAGLFGTAAIVLTVSTSSVSGAGAVVLTPVVSGLSNPVLVTHAGDGSRRLFIVEQTGKIRVVKNGALLPTPFIDFTGEFAQGGEQGLLGLAFHPRYETNGKFYINASLPDGDTIINEYRVSPTNPDVATRVGARRILRIDQPFENHNGGHIAFGPDGYLYIGMGDGGSGGDPGNRAQNLNSLLGKMLRININGTSPGHAYRIPASNPYVGRAGRDEIWSRGLRNPWRWSFDRRLGDLWIGDVGQGNYEEIDRSVARGTAARGRGANYGWRVLEGRHCFRPPSGCNRSGKVAPMVEYSHSQGCSVTGGYVYRGRAVPYLVNRYVFGDYCSGTIWAIPRAARAPAAKTLVIQTSYNISSFGEDESGELYVVDHAGGAVYRFAAP